MNTLPPLSRALECEQQRDPTHSKIANKWGTREPALEQKMRNGQHCSVPLRDEERRKAARAIRIYTNGEGIDAISVLGRASRMSKQSAMARLHWSLDDAQIRVRYANRFGTFRYEAKSALRRQKTKPALA